MWKRILVFLLLFVVVPGSVFAYQYFFLFELTRVHEVASGPLDVAIADLNNDKNNDVLVASRDGYALTVFFGDGEGGLQKSQELRTEFGVTSLALGDFNADTHLDVVTTLCNHGCTDNSIGFFLNDGAGKLSQDAVISVDSVPYNILAADFDFDDIADIVASDYPGSRFLFLKSKDSFPFYDETYLRAGTKTISLLAVDIDADGDQDILGSNHGDGSITLHVFDDGHSAITEEIMVGDLPYAIATGYFDDDRLIDIAVVHSTSPGEISLHRNLGDYRFEEMYRTQTLDRLIYVAPADFNLDGFDDVLVTQHKESTALVYLNDRKNGLEAEPHSIHSLNHIYSADIGDLNHDGIPDLVTVDFQAGNIAVSLGKPASGEQTQ